MAPEMVINQRNNGAEGSSQWGGKGLNYPRTVYVSQDTYDIFDQAKLPKRQSDPYAYVFGGIANDNNVDIKDIRESDQTAHNSLCNMVGDNKSITVVMLKRRHTQLGQAAGKAKDIRKKMDAVWFRGKMAEPAYSLIVQAMPFSDVIESVPVVTEAVIDGGIKKAHNRWQPEYRTGLGEGRKDMALRAEKFRRDSAETANILDGGTAADALRREYGEDGRLLLKKMMNEVDHSAYSYMHVLQHRPSRFMQADEQLAESGATAESFQLMLARYEEARFINMFGKDNQPVVEEWRPSAAFPGIDGLSVPVVKALYSEDEPSSSRARVDFDSMERWDYTPDWRGVLDHIECNASVNIRNLSAAKQGNVNALLELAELCKEGALDIPEDEKASYFARQLYIAAANKGSVEAQYRLGLLHADNRFTGPDGLRNDNVAVDWLTKAAKQDHPEAQAELGLMYYAAGRSGEDAHVSLINAHMWCKNAVKAGVRRADVFFTLGRLYQDGLVPLEDDAKTDEMRIATMEKWYIEATKEGHVEAMRKLGLAHFNRTKGLTGTGKTKGANDTDAAKYLHMAAQQNDLESIYCLGEMYLDKRVSAEDLVAKKTAVQFFKDAANRGFAQAQFKLGTMLINGEIGAKDGEPAYRKAARRFAEAAAQGHTEAQCELAHLYADGLARPKDGKSPDAAALDLYKQASDKGSQDAKLALATLYENGRGDAQPGSQTNQMVAKYLELAASHEEADASIAYKLAKLYAQRTPGLKNGRDGDKLAVKWYTQAANKGLVDAQYKLAQMYLEEGRVDIFLTDQQRVSLAEPWYVKAADAGHAQAQLDLGLLHLTHTPGLIGTGKTKGANDADAAWYLQMAANQNNPEAQFRLGQMLVSGKADIKDGKPDYQGAAQRFAAAAAQGHTEAQCELAHLYADGLPRPKDGKSPNAAALDLYKQASDKGSLEAKLALAWLYENGRGDAQPGSQTNQMIAKYLELAASHEEADASIAYKLAKLYAQRTPGLKNGQDGDKLAVKWYTQAANKGLVDAQYKLAQMYLEEGGVHDLTDQQRVSLAEPWYVKAADAGHAQAQLDLGLLHLTHTPGLIGTGKTKGANDADAAWYLQMAANQNNPEAQYYLGDMYLNARTSIKGLKAKEAALDYIKRAANGGFALAQIRLGKMLSNGEVDIKDGKPDYQGAAQRFAAAAAQGQTEAQWKLAHLYVNGLARPKDGKSPDAAALDLYKQMSDKGNLDAQLALAWLYKSGRGDAQPGSQTNQMVAKYLELAASHEEADASIAYKLAKLYAKRTPGLRNGQDGDKLAVKWYTQAANKGLVDAQYKLAQMYLEEGRVDIFLTDQQRVSLAEPWYVKAADAGHAQAQLDLGLLHLTHTPGLIGTGKTKGANDADAAWYLQMAANQNNPEAQYYLGDMYLNARTSIKGLKAKEAALDYIKRAANGGFALAQLRLGQMLVSGEVDIKDGKPDYQGAAQRFAAAAGQGDIEALCELARLFQKKLAHPWDGKSPDVAAEDLYEQAANKGSVVAQLALVDLYEAKANSAVDPAVNQKRAKYLELAAESGAADAQYKLASRRLVNRKDLPAGAEAEQKATEAFELLKQAAQQKHPKACYGLGQMYENPREFGLHKESDFAKAAKLYRVAAENDVALAQYRLGDLYRTGKAAPEGVDQKGARDEAKRLLEQAHKQGHMHASFYYGRMLLDDRSGSHNSDLVRGLGLMKNAANKGDPELQYVLAEYLFSCDPEAKKSLTQEGIRWLEKSAAQSHEQALRKLEQLYTKDLLSLEQKKQAQIFFETAAVKVKDPDPYAMRFLGWIYEKAENPFIACDWYYKAAQKIDDEYTLSKLGALTKAGKNVHVLNGDEDKEAAKYYQRAAVLAHTKN